MLEVESHDSERLENQFFLHQSTGRMRMISVISDFNFFPYSKMQVRKT